jgi:hypothetical protein
MKYNGIEIIENIMGLSDGEVKTLISCIVMAAREGFYDFQHSNVENANENLNSFLQKCGLAPEEIEEIVDGNWF